MDKSALFLWFLSLPAQSIGKDANPELTQLSTPKYTNPCFSKNEPGLIIGQTSYPNKNSTPPKILLFPRLGAVKT
jgi:hypothetical protein